MTETSKEQDTESGLDYFGARYYDHSLYRFLSVDPVIPAGRAVPNPQRWNLYAYCLGNPVNYVDPDGADAYRINIEIQRYGFGPPGTQAVYGYFIVNGKYLGVTLENGAHIIPLGTYKGTVIKHEGRFAIQLNYTSVLNYIAGIHESSNVKNLKNCIAPGKGFSDAETIYGSRDIMDELEQLYSTYMGLIEMNMEKAMAYLERAAYGSGMDMAFDSWAALDYMSYAMEWYFELMIEIQITSNAH